MASAGRILIIPHGAWDASRTYENLDLVTHNNYAWLAKKVSVGIEPSEGNSAYWMKMLGGEFLPIDGGTMRGAFYFSEGYGHLAGNDTEMLMIHFPNKGDTSEFEYLALNSKEGLGNMLRLNKVTPSGLQMFKIYGEHNKPTASDVGAAPATHTHSASEVGAPSTAEYDELKSETTRLKSETTRLKSDFTQLNVDVDTLESQVNMELLWENASPTSTFIDQVIPLNYDLENDELVVEFSAPSYQLIVRYGETKAISDAWVYQYARTVVATETGLYVSQGTQISVYGSTSSCPRNDDEIRPQRVYRKRR